MFVPGQDSQQKPSPNPAATLQRYTLPGLVSPGCGSKAVGVCTTGQGRVHFSEWYNHKVRSRLDAKSQDADVSLIHLRRYGQQLSLVYVKHPKCSHNANVWKTLAYSFS